MKIMTKKGGIMMGIKKVGQIGVPVQDRGGLRLLLSLPEKDEFAHASSVIYFQVEDLPAVYNEIATKGVSFPIEPHVAAKIEQTETWMAFFKDTEGNTLALMSEMQV